MVAIGEASRLSGVTVETIRYYERAGITSKPGRTASGRRAYSDADIAGLRFIKRCRDLGFSIRDAVTLRNLAADRESACETVERLGQSHLADVRRKIADLQRLETALAELVSNCSQGRRDCPMLDALMEPDPHASGPGRQAAES